MIKEFYKYLLRSSLIIFLLFTFQVNAKENIELVCECETQDIMVNVETSTSKCIRGSEKFIIDLNNNLVFFGKEVLPIEEITHAKYLVGDAKNLGGSYSSRYVSLDRYTGYLQSTYTQVTNQGTTNQHTTMLTLYYHCKKREQLF